MSTLCLSRYDRGGDHPEEGAGGPHHHEEFGFVTLDRTHTLKSFASYADWVKALHFSDPPPKVSPRCVGRPRAP